MFYSAECRREGGGAGGAGPGLASAWARGPEFALGGVSGHGLPRSLPKAGPEAGCLVPSFVLDTSPRRRCTIFCGCQGIDYSGDLRSYFLNRIENYTAFVYSSACVFV